MKIVHVLLVGLAICLVGCRADIAQLTAYGSDHKISVYSGGVLVKEYHSVGKVFTEEGSDGWYFMDKSSNKLVRVAGTVVVEQE